MRFPQLPSPTSKIQAVKKIDVAVLAGGQQQLAAVFVRLRNEQRAGASEIQIGIVQGPGIGRHVPIARIERGHRVQAPANSIVAVIAPRRMIDVEDHQFRFAVTVQIADCNAAGLIVVAEPTRDLNGIAPSARHCPGAVETAANPVVAMVGAGRIVDVKDNQFRQAVAVNIGSCDAATLILVAEPAGNLRGIGPAACYIAVRINTPTYAIIAVIGA